MKWLAVAVMWLVAATAVVASALILGPPARVSVFWIAAVAFAAALIGTMFVADTEAKR